MLLDQQRTKKFTRIVAIIMVVGLVGVLPLALGQIIFGGGDGAPSASTLIDDAEAKVAANPKDLAAYVSLANHYRDAGRNADAEATLQTALDLGAKNATDLRILIGAFSDDSAKQTTIVGKYTKKHPKDADGWLLAGNIASTTGDTLSARLAYQRVLTLVEPGSVTGQAAQAGLDTLQSITPSQIVPTTPGQ